jgi:hypothetical protein
LSAKALLFFDNHCEIVTFSFQRAIFAPNWSNTSSGIDTGASSSASGLDSDCDRLHRLISETTDDDEDYDLLTLALKNGIKVTRSPPGFQ